MLRAHIVGVLAIGLGALLSQAGCSVQVNHDGTEYRCDKNGICPSGFECVTGICVATAGTPDSPDSGPGGSDAGGEPGTDAGPDVSALCGTTDVIYDDFGNTDLEENRWWPWIFGDATIAEVGGEMELEIAAGSGNSGSGIVSQGLVELRSSRAMIEVVELDTSPDVWRVLRVEIGNENKYEIQEYNGQLSFEIRRDDVVIASASIRYSPAQHRFWQIREDSGTVYGEVSADGTNWTRIGMGEHVFADRLMNVSVLIWADLAAETVRGMRVRGVNGGSPGAALWCPGSTLSDTFDGGSLDVERWGRWGTSACTLTHREGVLWFGVPATGFSECGVSSNRRYDMRAGQLTVEVPSVGTAGVNTIFEIKEYSVASFRLSHRGSMLHAERELAGRSERLIERPYEASQHRWWRFRTSNGTLFWELSADGTNWTELTRSSFDPKHLDGVEVDLYTNANNPGPESRSGSFGSIHGTP